MSRKVGRDENTRISCKDYAFAFYAPTQTFRRWTHNVSRTSNVCLRRRNVTPACCTKYRSVTFVSRNFEWVICGFMVLLIEIAV